MALSIRARAHKLGLREISPPKVVLTGSSHLASEPRYYDRRFDRRHPVVA